MQPISNTPWSASQASPADAPSASSSSTAAGAATVTANDFLTLLVTELKNQDPTANTDPNTYATAHHANADTGDQRVDECGQSSCFVDAGHMANR
jgi:hypothetical protein